MATPKVTFKGKASPPPTPAPDGGPGEGDAPEDVPYVVKHAAVRHYYRGQTIPAGTFTAAEVARLLAHGAVVPEGEPLEPPPEAPIA